MTLTLSALAQQLRLFPQVKRFHVALSGGLDSMVLLHCMARLRNQGADWDLAAVHVHHGLHDDADDWTHFCENACQSLQVPYTVFQVDASPVSGESPEATARELRYQAIATEIKSGDALVTAHHQDDQAETLLLQLMRGCGPAGLAAMPAVVTYSAGLLVRPFLAFSRQQLRDFAIAHKIDWVEDSSNRDSRYDRNYMRHEIMPHLIKRWPGLLTSLYRTSSNMADASYLLDQLASQDLQQATTTRQGVLSLDDLLALDEVRLRNLLRFWLRDLNLPVPTKNQLQHVLRDIIFARSPSNPRVAWPGAEIRRYRQNIYAMATLANMLPPTEIAWDPREPIIINGIGRLSLRRSAQGQGLNPEILDSKLHIRFRQGGERIQPAQRGHLHALKKLFQEAGIPPWERSRTPILYQGGEIVAIAGLCDSENFYVSKDQKGLVLEWHKCFIDT